MSCTEQVRAAYLRLFSGSTPKRLGLAVSGGSDSTALLLLTREALPQIPLHVATIDHGLREQSAAEATEVGDLCARLGMSHETLRWRRPAGGGNLQRQAREGRRALLSEWAERHAIGHVALGHTSDDQAETVLLRLARGSGVDGLAAMAPRSHAGRIVWLRPLLSFSRESLKEELRQRGQGWVDDPSNEDPRFDRVRARAMGQTLAQLGLTNERLLRTAEQMALAREVLDRAAREILAAHARLEVGDVILSDLFVQEGARESFLRAFAHVLCWVASRTYRPRYDALLNCLDEVASGKTRNLHGCLVSPEGGGYRITREYAAVRDIVTPPGEWWDGRWKLTGPVPPAGARMAALGERGLDACPEWRLSGLPRSSLLATPALWQEKRLLAAPAAGVLGGYAMRARHGLKHLVSSLHTD